MKVDTILCYGSKIDINSPIGNSNSFLTKDQKISLIGLDKKELQDGLLKIDTRPFLAKQVWNWIYVKGVASFDQMSNISAPVRTKLAENYCLKKPDTSQDLTSSDGTRKWLLRFPDSREVEMVYIPEDDRGTLCVSSQVGCTLTCKFCHTGTQTLVRNLSAGEIVSGFMLARDLLEDWQSHHKSLLDKTPHNSVSLPPKRKITSIVFMGMGEPFFNYDQVKKAVEILTDVDGINFSKRKITISTSGLVPEIIKFSDEIKTVLAISLHATSDETRTKIMPINKKYPLHDLMKACEYYIKTNPSGRITFEYVTLKGVNDSDDDARNLVKLLKTHKLPALINLIPFNPWQGSFFECSSRNRIMAFGKIIKDAGYTVTIRKTKGQDVMAACGQLRSASQRTTVNKKHIQ